MIYDEYGLEGFEYWNALKHIAIKNDSCFDLEDCHVDEDDYSWRHLSLDRITGWIRDCDRIEFVKDGHAADKGGGLPSIFSRFIIGWYDARGFRHRDIGPAVVSANGRGTFWSSGYQIPIEVWLENSLLSNEKKVMLKLRWG